MTPDHKTEESDAYHGVNYTKVSEDSFVRIGRDNMGDCSECGNDKNIDLGMTEKSKEVLVEDGVTPSRRVVEAS